MQTYSDFFKTLHDETHPTGYLGRGTHYSVLRAIVFHDPMGRPLPQGQFADFAVIWDEDHDVRVMEPVEEIYRRGMLSSFVMFGERKGFFTAVLSELIPSADEVLFNPTFLMRLDELELSLRSTNGLKNSNMVYVGDLVQKSEADLLRDTTFGYKSLNEIKNVLALMGLHLGVEIPGWPPSDLDKLAQAFADQRLSNDSMRVGLLETEINNICQSLNDAWASQVAAFGSADNPIISDDGAKVALYLRNLKMLWQLGLVPTERQKLQTVVSNMMRRHRHPVDAEESPAD